MDRWLVLALALLASGALLTIGASSSGLMGHYDAKVFVVVAGALALLLVLATDRSLRNRR